MTTPRGRNLSSGGPTRQAGASLIEVVITITIFAVLLAAGVPSFQEWIANSRVRTSSDSILNGLQVARAESIRRNRLVEFRQVDVEGGWRVVSAPESQMCPDLSPAATEIIQQRGATEGASGITVSSLPAGAASVTFSPMGVVTSLCGNPITRLDVSTATIANPRALRVTISPSGGMRMCEPSRPSSDPRACP